MEYLDKWMTIERFIEAGRSLDKEQIIYLLNRIPVFDVVRCSECKYYEKPEWSVVFRCTRDDWSEEHEALDMAIEALKQVTGKLNNPDDSLLTTDPEARKEQKSKLDLISRAEAIEAVRLETGMRGLLGRGDILEILSSLPSAEAEPIVIRINKLLRKEEFDKLAEDIKRQGENIICIPCDAEVVSADAVKVAYICDGRKCNSDCSECSRTLDIEHARDFKLIGSAYYQQESADAVYRWIPLLHDDDGMGTDFPYERDGEWVIVTDGKTISVERIKKDAYDHFFPNGRWFELEDAIAWMPLPEPYKDGERSEE